MRSGWPMGNLFIQRNFYFYFFLGWLWALHGYSEQKPKKEITWDSPPDPQALKELSREPNGKLRVFFWNINGYWQVNRFPTDWRGEKRKSDLDKNIEALIDSPHAPEVMIFAEYQEGAFHKETLELLRKSHPHFQYIPYQAELPQGGFLIHSKSAFPFQTSEPEPLDFAPSHIHPEWQNRYREAWAKKRGVSPEQLKRPYVKIEVETQEGSVVLVPVHFIQPWSAMKASIISQEGEGIFSNLTANVFIAKEIIQGSQNPHINQVEYLLQRLKEDFGHHLSSRPLLLLGDFNFPKRLLMFETAAYQKLSSSLNDPFSESKQVSFPARKGQPQTGWGGQKILIDRAFEQGVQVFSAQVMPLAGSDHLPICLAIKPKFDARHQHQALRTASGR